MNDTVPVLITGCSSGVGRASARRFLHAGHPVYATARSPETLAELVEEGAVGLRLDVTDEESMAAAVKRVEADHGAVGILVNNAAYGLQGAVEAVLLDDLRAQFETNVFGMVRMTQLVLPGMRAQRRGRIINLSSMGGHFTLPGSIGLHASKHAVEAISDGLRMELRPFGIQVVVIEAGSDRHLVRKDAQRQPPHQHGRRHVRPFPRGGCRQGRRRLRTEGQEPRAQRRPGRQGHREGRTHPPAADPVPRRGLCQISGLHESAAAGCGPRRRHPVTVPGTEAAVPAGYRHGAPRVMAGPTWKADG